MALTDHVAILLGHSLDVPRLNKKKTRSDYYAQIAFPPAALNDLAALVAAAYPGVPLNTLEVNIAPNAQQAKPFVGVPADWYVVRFASTFTPELYAADGTTQIPHTTARSTFYSGMKVRVHSSAWGWTNEFKKSGASFNLLGLMDAGAGGERLAIGGGHAGAAFAAHANPNAAPQNGAGGAGSPFGAQAAPVAQSAHAAVATAPSATAFAQPAAQFAQVGAVAAGNPFQQNAGAAAQGANPFA